MAETAYSYDENADFPGAPAGSCEPTTLHAEMAAADWAPTTFTRIEVDQAEGASNRTIRCIFADALSAAKKTQLDGDVSGPAGGMIATHVNTAIAFAQEVPTGHRLYIGDVASGAIVEWNTAQTNDHTMVGLPDAAPFVSIVNQSQLGTDFARAATVPTLFIEHDSDTAVFFSASATVVGWNQGTAWAQSVMERTVPAGGVGVQFRLYNGVVPLRISNGTAAAASQWFNDRSMGFGGTAGGFTQIEHNTGPAVDALSIWCQTPADATNFGGIFVGDHANKAKDHDYTAKSDPTWRQASSGDPDVANDEWFELEHDGTSCVLTLGSGQLSIVDGGLAIPAGEQLNFDGSALGQEYIKSTGSAMDFVNQGTTVLRLNSSNWVDVLNGGLRIGDNLNLGFGAGGGGAGDSRVEYHTAHTNDSLTIWLATPGDATNGGTLIIGDLTNEALDLAFASQTNPTLVGSSATLWSSATDETWSLAHDGTDLIIDQGSGVIDFAGLSKAAIGAETVTDYFTVKIAGVSVKVAIVS